MNVAGLEPAPPGNRPGALTTKPYVLIALRRNFYTLVTTYLLTKTNLYFNTVILIQKSAHTETIYIRKTIYYIICYRNRNASIVVQFWKDYPLYEIRGAKMKWRNIFGLFKWNKLLPLVCGAIYKPNIL